jgi:putative alpha-1,2-mannosidase
MLCFTEADYIPKWPLANGWTNEMIGSHADVIIADSITKNEINGNLDLD